MRISRFSEDTVGLAQQAAKQFKSTNVRGIILDVRGNPGGLLNTAVDVSSLWLKPGALILEEKRENTVIRDYRASGKNPLFGVPTVVLVNEGSASASEIVAGALKDNGAATLIGTKTFGKGSVQQVERLRGGGILKVTIARWYTPSGRNIDKEGIEPGKTVEITEEDSKTSRDPQKDAAQQALQR
jgi:carboxyl-terminal processing protease